ncbi:PspC family transcriptional regulator [Enterococcus pseudoavium]|nr:PspC family transcriptional regulator [Enterococcus pseudoavium]
MNKRLMKSQKNRVLTGTLGGLAEYFGIDATISRVIFIVALFIFDGAPILLYLLFALLMPKPTQKNDEVNKTFQSKPRPKRKKSEDDEWSDF